MPAKVKFEQVEMLRSKLSRSKAVFVGEYRGMTVAQITDLRARVRAAGGEMKVAKNTLMKIAMSEEGMVAFPDDISFGPNVFTMAYEDPAAVAKVLRDFAKDRTNKAFSIKGGVLGDSVLTAAQLEALADLPGREVLIGMAVSAIAAPISGFLNVLNGTARGLVTCLEQIREKKEKAA
ncbi:MAG: 50S ribosomal protein L10 [Aminivibrio sp.]|jgi:large subunit ribosomal protein L10|nr:50S ribosomal protein L10 [Synergistaceae bacterium]